MSLPLKFDPQGLVPTVVQDHITGEIRMFAFATDAAVRKTLETGRATFYSRSRAELWQKGRGSGQEIPVVRVLADCDADCIVYSSEPQAPSCNSGAPSCFFQAFDGERLSQRSGQPQTVLASLEIALDGGRKSMGTPASARGGRMSDGPSPDAGAKICNEAAELARALEKEGDESVVTEAADVLYQVVVGLRSRSIAIRRVLAELAHRLEPEGVAPPTSPT